MTETISLAIAGLALFGQLVNVFLHLRIQNAILTAKSDILATTDKRYVHRAVHQVQHADVERRLAMLEPKRA